jgi:hypothetical protein
MGTFPVRVLLKVVTWSNAFLQPKAVTLVMASSGSCVVGLKGVPPMERSDLWHGSVLPA